MRHSKPTRRTVLTGMAAAAGTLTLNRLGAFAQPRTVPGPAKTDELISGMGKVNGQLVPFPMTDVRLTDSIFKQQAEYNQQYLASLSTDRLLHSFRLTSGITSTVVPYGGWEKPDCELRGHFNDVVNQVYRKDTRVVVEKSGIPVAALVSTDDLASAA